MADLTCKRTDAALASCSASGCDDPCKTALGCQEHCWQQHWWYRASEGALPCTAACRHSHDATCSTSYPCSRRAAAAAGRNQTSPLTALLRTITLVMVVVLTVASRLPAANASREKPTIAIVNEKAFHLEVLAGFMHVLEDRAESVTVYMHSLNFEGRHLDFGFGKFMRGFRGTVRALPLLTVPRFDLVIFISPEYRLGYAQQFIQRARPSAVVAVVHNGDATALPQLPSLHPNLHIVTLSPHVTRFVSDRLNGTVAIDWLLPLKPLMPRTPCAADGLSACLSGFAIQGNMDARRRNYSSIWEQVDQHVNASRASQGDDKRLVVNVVGAGDPRKLLVPSRLEGRIRPHVNLQFVEFYELIYRNLALLPSLASDAYFDRKFSSTVITSLVTGVPIIVSPKFLQAYSFMNELDVLVQGETERPIDVMSRVLALGPAQLTAQRQRVAALREHLNARARKLLEEVLMSHEPGKRSLSTKY